MPVGASVKRGSQTEYKGIESGGDGGKLEGACPLLKGQLLVASNRLLSYTKVGLTLSDF